MASRKTKAANPFVDIALGALERQGQKMFRDFLQGGIPGVVDGALEDVEKVSEEVSRRTKTARGKIAARQKRR